MRASRLTAMKPKRIQMKRTAGWRKPAGVVYVGRPTKWGNPWIVGGKAPGALDAPAAKAEYERALTRGELKDKRGRPLYDQLYELRGKSLGCWCDAGAPCHADVLLHYANAAR